jgi:hypothetical protein
MYLDLHVTFENNSLYNWNTAESGLKHYALTLTHIRKNTGVPIPIIDWGTHLTE